MQVSRESHWSGTESCGSLAKVQASARVDVPTAPIFLQSDQGVQHVCTSFLHENAWICARRTTDGDPVRVIPDTMPPETYSNDFGGFLELTSRFEFEFCRCEFFFEGFEFLVCSCEWAVACLCPRNSISNVVASVMIGANIYIHIYI